MIPYEQVPFELPPLPKRRRRRAGIPDSVTFANKVPEIY